METQELLSFISSRASAKVPGDGEVSLEEIIRALEVATSAPSAHNAQPWRFVIIKDSRVKEELIEEMATLWREDLMRDGLDEKIIEEVVKTSTERSMKASAIIVVCLTMDEMHKYPDDRRKRCEYIMAVQSVAAAIENMLLAFHAMGISACWRSSALFASEVVKKVLRIPDPFEPQAMIEVSRGGLSSKPPRKPLSEVACLNFWGNPI
ncbi:MAG: nitroreductase family protein [Nitrososphaerota archaeon]|nr:nitroreductase family protein [Aigarchaeota archaeon]MDW8076964.1 nitroreductase family protein [Nitrososphaerota archaeon]